MLMNWKLPITYSGLSLLLLLAGSLLSGCAVFFPEALWIQGKFPRNHLHIVTPDSLPEPEPTIQPGDILHIRVLSRDGTNLLGPVNTPLSPSPSGTPASPGWQVEVSPAGSVTLPWIGTLHVAGLTLFQAEDTLRSRFLQFFPDILVTIRFVNHPIYVFWGNQAGEVVRMPESPVPLVEVLAEAGGTRPGVSVHTVYLVRKTDGRVFLTRLNLRRRESILLAYTPVYRHDMIYVLPGMGPVRVLSQEILPWIYAISATTNLILTLLLLIR